MPRFLVDEDLPRSLARALREAGIHAEDARDVGLRGSSDDEILEYASARALGLLTGDIGFGNILRFPLGSHAGVVIARFPNEMTIPSLNSAILNAIRDLSDDDLSGNLVILEPGKIRLRRKG